MPVNRQEKELELGGSWRREKCKRKRGKGHSKRNQKSQNCLLVYDAQRRRDKWRELKTEASA